MHGVSQPTSRMLDLEDPLMVSCPTTRMNFLTHLWYQRTIDTRSNDVLVRDYLFFYTIMLTSPFRRVAPRVKTLPILWSDWIMPFRAKRIEGGCGISA